MIGFLYKCVCVLTIVAYRVNLSVCVDLWCRALLWPFALLGRVDAYMAESQPTLHHHAMHYYHRLEDISIAGLLFRLARWALFVPAMMLGRYRERLWESNIVPLQQLARRVLVVVGALPSSTDIPLSALADDFRDCLWRFAPHHFPSSRMFTIDELRAYDGSDSTKPLYIAVKGRVYDVGYSNENYGPGTKYGCYAGKHPNRALALMSVQEQDLIPDTTGLSPIDLETLDSWETFFQSKYRLVGYLHSQG
eukprot:TRINITY_DN4748_c0_g2_i1.p2 TRINITY_DN4748_c0_g2~~TRINITY_DN4748_c0_g2_i1.p2  ORF type:complete len:250 (+),score=52.54 TRINITY_DN4748_c0_g2_i1:45-794(+)